MVYNLFMIIYLVYLVRGELSSVMDPTGVQFVVMTGIIMMLLLYVENWDIQQMVNLYQQLHDLYIIINMVPLL